jgi:acetyl-CoA synthetase
MSDVYDPHDRICGESHITSMDDYRAMHKESVDEPAAFWGKIAAQFHWDATPSKEKFLEYNFDCNKGPVSVKWMQDSRTNLSYNCLDRHLEKDGGKVAFHWEGNDLRDEGQITYEQLHKEVCKFANVLKSKGVKKGDRVAIYMPMVNELVVAMLACARIGAVHSIVFGGYR